MPKIILTILLCAPLAAFASPAVTIDLTLPEMDVDPYHKPFVVAWLETPRREGVTTIEVWYDQTDWLKDMRQWWRKLGRASGKTLDGVTGATRQPGRYQIVWHGKDVNGEPVPAGEYLLSLEAAREEGGRSYLRQLITLGQPGSYTLDANPELGPVTITVH